MTENAKSLAFCLALQLAVLLVFPFIYLEGSGCDVKLFTPSTLAMLALAFVLLTPRKLASAFSGSGLFPALPVAVMAAIAFGHFLLDGRWKFEDLAQSLAWLAWPLFVWINRKAIVKTLPWFMAALWLLNFALSLLDLHLGRTLGGLPGNWNWDALLALIGAPFLVWLFFRFLGGRGLFKKALVWLLSSSVVLSTLWLLWSCESRGAWLGLIVSGSLAAFLLAPPKRRRVLLAVGAALVLAGASLFVLKGTGYAAKVLSEDVRLSLWESAVAMAAEHPVFGVGQASFESEFATFRSPEYFFKAVASVRTNHPHNNLLYIACGFGCVGLLAWFALLVYPCCLFGASFRRRAPLSKIFFLAFIAALTHALFDLIFFEWPTSMASLLLLGVLWTFAWPWRERSSSGEEPAPGAAALSCAAKASGLLLLAVALLSASLCFFAHLDSLKAASFSGDSAMAPLAAGLHEKAASLCRTEPLLLYRGATQAYLKARDSELVLRRLSEMDDTPWWNFAHANGFRSKALQSQGRNREAIGYALKECANYPLQTLPLYDLAGIYRRTGQLDNASAAETALVAVLKMRGLELNDLKRILENPEFDLHFKKTSAAPSP